MKGVQETSFATRSIDVRVMLSRDAAFIIALKSFQTDELTTDDGLRSMHFGYFLE